MINEGIRGLMGEELAGRVEVALKGKGKDGKDVDIVIGNDGSYVPAEKYNGAVGGRTSAENALKAAAEALKALGGSGDPAKLADDVGKAQTAVSELRTKHDEEIKKLGRSTALKLALGGKVHDPADVMGLMELDKLELDDDGNLKTDIDSLLEPIRKAKPYLFTEQTGDIKGAKPAQSGTQTSQRSRADGPVIL